MRAWPTKCAPSPTTTSSLIVGDIPPLAFEVARELRVPGVAISNFTWDWILETHPGMSEAAPWLVPRLRSAYSRATLALELPFAGGFEIFPKVQRLPLVARQHTRDAKDTRTRFGIPHDRPAALLSFGGYGLPDLDLSRLDILKAQAGWTVVTTGSQLSAGRDASGRHLQYRSRNSLRLDSATRISSRPRT
jgi:hypothetical protein